jgi:hypothetical protein
MKYLVLFEQQRNSDVDNLTSLERPPIGTDVFAWVVSFAERLFVASNNRSKRTDTILGGV